MEPSKEFCPSGCTCTCSFSLGPGSIVEEKAKNGSKQPKKEKDNNNYNYNKKNMDWGVGKVISATSFADFLFFRLFPFGAGAWAHTNKALKRTWCCNHLYQREIEEICKSYL